MGTQTWSTCIPTAFLKLNENGAPVTLSRSLAGVYAAALTPLNRDFSLSPEALLPFLNFLAARGCHGALLFGSTGEGPSFAPNERTVLLRAALEIRRDYPDFRLIAATGSPSLEESIELTKTAFDLGFDAALSLPPYYFRQAPDDGLFAWFDLLIRRAVPEGASLFGYHYPGQAGIGLSIDLLARLKDAHPSKFAGIKDSSGDPGYAIALGQKFGDDFLVFNGNDKIIIHALKNRAAGAMTAITSLYSPLLREIWDSFQQGVEAIETQEKLAALSKTIGRYAPYPSIMKALLVRLHGIDLGPVRPPLLPTPEDLVEKCVQELASIL